MKEELADREKVILSLEHKLQDLDSRAKLTDIDLIKQENSELQQYILQLESDLGNIQKSQLEEKINVRHINLWFT